ncbi:MAG TPA: DUF4396 domain-containing protein [Terriglobia bacterium]|nr:DUF4396 domain-containing protein [Terriglobia bacterium]
MAPYPDWLHVLAWVSLAFSCLCALGIIVDEFRRPQRMAIMNFVWPITALYFGPLAVAAYLRSGLKSTRRRHQRMMQQIELELARERAAGVEPRPPVSGPSLPTGEQVAVAVSHCGAGCTLGDIGAECWVFLMALTFAGGDFQTRILLDFLLAWSFGVAFQYFTIAPLRGYSLRRGLLEAMRVDTLSIVAFQVGMSAWMALTYFVIFPGPHLHPNQAVFWFMMQIAMVIGYFTCYPANVFLLKSGWKEKMPQSKQEMKRKTLERWNAQAA